MVKQAYLHEHSRPPGCITFMNTIDKNVEPLHSLHTKFFPYKNPYENIYEIPDGNLLLYTYQIFHNEWRTKLEDSIKGETYRSFKDNILDQIRDDVGQRISSMSYNRQEGFRIHCMCRSNATSTMQPV